MDFCAEHHKPAHSVILPNYNDGRKLGPTLDSVLRQSFKNYEIVIVDDGSTDDSRSIIQAYAQKYSCIRPIFSSKNQGVNAAISEGVAQARGTYLSFLASGDFYLPNYLSAAHESFTMHPDAVIWCCLIDLFKQAQKPTILEPIERPPSHFYPKEQIVHTFRNTPFWIHGTATILLKQVYLDYKGFQSHLGPQADWLFFHTIALDHGIAHTPAKLALMELSDLSYSRAIHLNRQKRNEGYWRVIHYLYQNEAHLNKFAQAGLLSSISDTLFWKLIRKPRYWKLLRHSKSSTVKRIFHSVTKKIKAPS